eukprot:6819674-Prymnesium_polylepis.1
MQLFPVLLWMPAPAAVSCDELGMGTVGATWPVCAERSPERAVSNCRGKGSDSCANQAKAPCGQARGCAGVGR